MQIEAWVQGTSDRLIGVKVRPPHHAIDPELSVCQVSGLFSVPGMGRAQFRLEYFVCESSPSDASSYTNSRTSAHDLEKFGGAAFRCLETNQHDVSRYQLNVQTAINGNIRMHFLRHAGLRKLSGSLASFFFSRSIAVVSINICSTHPVLSIGRLHPSTRGERWRALKRNLHHSKSILSGAFDTFHCLCP